MPSGVDVGDLRALPMAGHGAYPDAPMQFLLGSYIYNPKAEDRTYPKTNHIGASGDWKITKSP